MTLTEEHLELARKMAGRYAGILGRDDAIGEANLGLVEAGRTWNDSRGPFRPWAVTCIRRQLIRAVRAELGRGNRPRRPVPVEEVRTTDTAPGADEEIFARGTYLLEHLPARERDLLFRFHLEVAARLGVDSSRVSQIIARGHHLARLAS